MGRWGQAGGCQKEEKATGTSKLFEAFKTSIVANVLNKGTGASEVLAPQLEQSENEQVGVSSFVLQCFEEVLPKAWEFSGESISKGQQPDILEKAAKSTMKLPRIAPSVCTFIILTHS